MNYTDLQSDVALWVDRDDLALFIPRFIGIAEHRINRVLRTIDQESVITTPLSGDKYDLPVDYLEMRNIYLDGQPRVKLRFLSPENMLLSYKYTQPFPPESYTISDGKVRVAPPSDNSTTPTRNLVMEYYKRFPALSAVNLNNWLTDNAYDVLLYASLAECNYFLMNKEDADTWLARYEQAVDSLNTTQERARFSGGAIEVRSPYSGI